jgi:type IX secretion system PorP/SprF family membrane protein
MINRRFDPSKFKMGDQWNPVTGFNATPSSDLPVRNKSMVFDAGAGILYYDANPNKKANIYGGFSAHHLNQPEDAFASGVKEKLPMRFTGHGGVRIALTDNFSLTPNFLYLRQGTASEKMAGAYATIKAMPSTDFLFGANYRFEDAISPYFGITHNNMVIGVSYDYNTSDLGKMVRGTSSIEISLSIIGRKSVKTPEEHFVCPRL